MSFLYLKLSKILNHQVLPGLLCCKHDLLWHGVGTSIPGTEVSLRSVGEAPLWELVSLRQEINVMAQENLFVVVNKLTSLAFYLNTLHVCICPNTGRNI